MVGEALDFWRVEERIPEQVLRLRAEMRLPGRAWLQFEVTPATGLGCRLRATAFFEPHGVMGALYWWAMYPFHRYIFDRMFAELARRAVMRLRGI